MKWARHSQNETIFSCPRNQLTKFVGFLSNYLHMLKSVIILLYFCFSLINAFIDMIVVEVKQGRMYNSIQTLTSILKVLLKQYKSPTGRNKFSRGITPTTADQKGPKVISS